MSVDLEEVRQPLREERARVFEDTSGLMEAALPFATKCVDCKRREERG